MGREAAAWLADLGIALRPFPSDTILILPGSRSGIHRMPISPDRAAVADW